MNMNQILKSLCFIAICPSLLVAVDVPPGDSGNHPMPLQANDMPSLWKERTHLQEETQPFFQRVMNDPEIKRLNEELDKIRASIDNKTQALLNAQPGYAEVRDKLTKVEQRLGIRPMETNKAAPNNPEIPGDRPSAPIKSSPTEEVRATSETGNGF